MKNLQQISIQDIRMDQSAQARARMSEDVVVEYAASMASSKFPPIDVYRDAEGVAWLADGWHRTHAAMRNGDHSIWAYVREGGAREALRHSIGSNSAHGLRRTSADKTRAVTLLLTDSEWGSYSDRQLARMAKVSPTFVGKVRKSAVPQGTQKRTYRHKSGKNAVWKMKRPAAVLKRGSCDDAMSDVKGAKLVHADPAWGRTKMDEVVRKLNASHARCAPHAHAVLWIPDSRLPELLASSLKWDFRGVGCWMHDVDAQVSGSMRRNSSTFVVLGKGDPAVDGVPSCIHASGNPGDGKPVAVLLEIVAGLTSKGGLVLDLWAGMAPAAAACVKLGREYLGAEPDTARHARAMTGLPAKVKA